MRLRRPGALSRLPIITDIECARAFLEKRRETECTCCYGHLGCSSYPGGPCVDETLGTFPELEE
jgi:hypothetical protein